MIDRAALLADLQKLLQRLEADLLLRSESAEVPEVGRRLREEYDRAKKAQRTAQNYEDWRSDTITQAAAAWVLSCVFVRFLEDNRLIDPPKIAGPGKRLQQARDEWELYLGQARQPNERDYLLGVFDELAGLPGAKEVFGEHNPIRELPNWLSGDGARELLAFFQKIDADTGTLVHDFTSSQQSAVSSQQSAVASSRPESCSLKADSFDETRFLGDLYQDLSEAARKKYALLQTPEFVEEFILDRTLDPALDEFGLGSLSFVLGSLRGDQPPTTNQEPRTTNQEPRTKNQEPFRMIDPACGSGHFLLGSFRRILDRWQRKEPGANIRDLVQRTLDSIHGVDVNPYAVAIARFRLLLVAMKACGVTRLADAPAFHFNLVCGDSLLHGSAGGDQQLMGFHELAHVYQSEDAAELRRILRPGQYHAVVANPPYITPKDKALNEAYRERYSTCHRQYSLAVPFMQRLFDLAIQEPRTKNQELSSGFVGQITANSFMKREFGKKLIEEHFPKIDLTHVIDTSGAYIPGHGTPTVILFGRNRPPVAKTIRTVMGIRGEPVTPNDPARGLVWSAIVGQIDQPGSQSEFVSVADSARGLFHRHPWSIGGGGAAELKERLEEQSSCELGEVAEAIGRTISTQGDDAYVNPPISLRRRRVPAEHDRRFVAGDDVRDWMLQNGDHVVFPYDETGSPVSDERNHCGLRFLWQARTVLANTFMFGGRTKVEVGLKWYEYGQWLPHRFKTPLTIVFAFVATHNHFVLDRGGKVFNRSAPVIKLPSDADEADHFGLLGLLNSSSGCFWMKQVFHSKGSQGVNEGLKTEAWEHFREFTGTGMLKFPVPGERPLDVTRSLDARSKRLHSLSPSISLDACLCATESLRARLDEALNRWQQTREEMIALQEELDWGCYRLYRLTTQDLRYSGGSPPLIRLGQRAFEIVLARKMAAGELQTTWFERHGSTPITELPAEWPEDYKRLVERRIELIETDRNIALIEQPEYKRRWNTEPWESQLERALRDWLLDRLESYFDFDGRMGSSFLVLGSSFLVDGRQDVGEEPTTKNQEQRTKNNPPLADIALVSVARLADIARHDADFMQVGELYRDDPAFDVERLVAELVEAESVPLLPVLRYKPAGLRKRAEWEQTWELQREEDRTGKRLDIPVPPKYTSADFLKSDYWRLRGKLDVPKERWVSFPHCEGPDGTLVIAWAGYDHLQLGRAVSAYFVDVQERLGGRDDPRLLPLLACLVELLPWIKQWHNEPDAAYDGLRMGDYFEGFLQEEARQLGKTIPEITAWQPPQRAAGRGGRGKKK